MVDRPDWMTNLDIRILDMLERTTRVFVDGMWMMPKTVAIHLQAEESYVGKRLRELEERGYVETNNGRYRITRQGLDYIQAVRP